MRCVECGKAIRWWQRFLTLTKGDLKAHIHNGCAAEAGKKRYAARHMCSSVCQYMGCPYQ